MNDSQLDALLRTHFAAPKLPSDAFTRQVLALLPLPPPPEELAAFLEHERRSRTRRNWFATAGAFIGVAFFLSDLRGVDWPATINQAGQAAQQAVTDVVLPPLAPLATASATTLLALAFVFWGTLRRWTLRQWEQLA